MPTLRSRLSNTSDIGEEFSPHPTLSPGESRGSAGGGELGEVFDEGADGAVVALDFGVRGFDDVVLVAGVGAAGPAERRRGSPVKT